MPADRERHPPLPPDIDGFDLAALTPDPLGNAINDGLEGIWLQIRPDNVHEIVAVQRTPPHPASKHSPSKKIPRTPRADDTWPRFEQNPAGCPTGQRSEERRVGNEWRARWPP